MQFILLTDKRKPHSHQSTVKKYLIAFIHNKILRKLGIKGNCLDLIKCMYKISIVNITLNGKLNAFPLRSGTKARMSTLTTLFNIIPQVLANATRHGGEAEAGILTGKEGKRNKKFISPFQCMNLICIPL